MLAADEWNERQKRLRYDGALRALAIIIGYRSDKRLDGDDLIKMMTGEDIRTPETKEAMEEMYRLSKERAARARLK